MALTYAIQAKNVVGALRINRVRVTIGAAGDYSTGLTLAPRSCGVDTINTVVYLGSSGGTTRANWEYDHTAGKLRGYKSNTASLHTEVAGSDVSGFVIELLVYGDQAQKG